MSFSSQAKRYLILNLSHSKLGSFLKCSNILSCSLKAFPIIAIRYLCIYEFFPPVECEFYEVMDQICLVNVKCPPCITV